jgi:hypothetical protein
MLISLPFSSRKFYYDGERCLRESALATLQLSCIVNFCTFVPKKKPGNLKILSFILSFYILSLAFIPCVDDNFSDITGKHVIVQSAKISHCLDIDQCSPFCVCSCCGTSVLKNSIVSFVPVNIIPSKLNFFYFVREIKGISNSYWKPPKA